MLNGLVAEKIKAHLKMHDLTPAEFAAKAGMERSTLSRFLRGKAGISLSMLELIAKGLDRQPWELLFKGANDNKGKLSDPAAEALTKELQTLRQMITDLDTFGEKLRKLKTQIEVHNSDLIYDDEILNLIDGFSSAGPVTQALCLALVEHTQPLQSLSESSSSDPRFVSDLKSVLKKLNYLASLIAK